MSPRLTRSLAEILYHKTKGNPLFFSRLMISLNKEGLLRLSLSRKRWIWEEEAVQLKELPDDVALFFTHTIRQLSVDMQSAICVLSCFGKSAERFVLETLENEFKMRLTGPLKEAVAEGLLCYRNDKFMFSHDFIQEASYNMMKTEERLTHHSKYGLVLCAEALKCNNNNMFFTAVSQLNCGGPVALPDRSRCLTVANMNLVAGKKAAEMTDFATAFSYFNHGIDFLKFLTDDHWEKNYGLSLDLFECASKSAFVVGDSDSLSEFSNKLLKNARSFHDKLNTLYVTTNALAHASNIQESVDRTISILAQLGIDIPWNCALTEMKLQMMKTRDMLVELSDEDIISYKRMTDGSKIMAMKFLSKMQAMLYMVRPHSQPLIILKMIQLSLAHGFSPTTPVAFGYFGSFLAKLGDIRGGYRFVKIGRDINSRYGSKEFAGEVMSVITEITCYVEPAQIAKEYHVEGYNVSMAAGDVGNAALSSLLYSIDTFWSGSRLESAKLQLANARQFMEQQNSLMWLMQLLPLERSVMALIGNTDTDNFGCKENAREHALLQNNPHQSMGFYFNKMYVSYLFRDFEETKGFAEIYLCQMYKFSPWILVYVHSKHTFITGLVSFWICRKSQYDRTWARRGQAAILEMKTFEESSSWTFEHMLLLLEAEDLYCERDFEGAKSSYSRAIASAKEHKFIHEEALACELAGFFYFELGEKSTALEYFTRARKRYLDWGAVAKARKLYGFIEESICVSPTDKSPLLPLYPMAQSELNDPQCKNYSGSPLMTSLKNPCS